MKIIPKNKKDKMFAKILNELNNEWMRDYPELEEDIQELSAKVVSFNIKYGTKLKLDKIIK